MKRPGKTNETQAGMPHEPPTDARGHTACFANGMKLFSAGEFAAALEVFEIASDGPELAVNESARMYARICQQKLDRQRNRFVRGALRVRHGPAPAGTIP